MAGLTFCQVGILMQVGKIKRDYPLLSVDQRLLHVFADLYPWLDQIVLVLSETTNTDYVETFQPKMGDLILLLDYNGECLPFRVSIETLNQIDNIAEWIKSSPFWGDKLEKVFGYRCHA